MATLKMVGEYIREQRQQAKISLRQLAQTAGVSNPYLSQIERGLRKPSAEVLQQIAKGLRISAEALYVQAGFLEDRQHDTEVPSAVLADTAINERQKQVLLDIYESFRKENDNIAPREGAAAAAGDSEDGPPRRRQRPARRTPGSVNGRRGNGKDGTGAPAATINSTGEED